MRVYESLRKYGWRWRLRQRIAHRVMRRMLDTDRILAAEEAFEQSRQKAGRPRQLLYFHQVDDPYSALAAQSLPQLLAHYDVELVPRLVPPPGADMAPEPQMASAYARRDAAAIAPFHGLRFTDPGEDPPPREVLFAGRVLAGCKPAQFAELAAEVSAHLWAGDVAGMKKSAAGCKLPSVENLRHLLYENAELRTKMGHYNGAMFHYGGAWYWGIDRLPHLQKRLDRAGARRKNAPEGLIAPRGAITPMPEHYDGPRMELDFYPSLRSPYTYLAVGETLALAKSYPVNIHTLPVLPMIMRGLPVPPRKGFYILRDTGREAQARGLPFGNILDPVGPPVQRAYSLLPYVSEEGKAGDYLHQLLKEAWSEGCDIFNLARLRRIVEGLGLSWEKALKWLDSDDWQKQAEANRQAMFAAGCWGVPSLHLKGAGNAPDLAVWGQDRIWLIADAIARRAQAARRA